LNDFEVFMTENLSEESYEELKLEYPDILFETNNLVFWKKVFGVERLLF
jgi:hypothetical protein